MDQGRIGPRIALTELVEIIQFRRVQSFHASPRKFQWQSLALHVGCLTNVIHPKHSGSSSNAAVLARPDHRIPDSTLRLM